MGKFRKKPVVIDAFEWTGELGANNKLLKWLTTDCGLQTARATYIFKVVFLDDREELIVLTLEGEMQANRGDWIIRGVKGEFYPCKPDIFEATYELVEEEKGK